MPASAELLLDTSAALALVSPTNERYRAVRIRTSGRRLGLAGHAAFETYSVLTRLPPPLRLPADAARRLLASLFPASEFIDGPAASGLVSEFADRGIAGGAVFDGLVAAAARVHGLELLSCDRRAAGTYAALGVRYELL